jgi:hypothetical protein
MIELVDGVFVQPEKVALIRALGTGKCAVFTDGQSAVDGGFLIEMEAVDAADKIDEALEDED